MKDYYDELQKVTLWWEAKALETVLTDEGEYKVTRDGGIPVWRGYAPTEASAEYYARVAAIQRASEFIGNDE